MMSCAAAAAAAAAVVVAAVTYCSLAYFFTPGSFSLVTVYKETKIGTDS